MLLILADFINPPSDTSRKWLCVQCGDQHLVGRKLPFWEISVFRAQGAGLTLSFMSKLLYFFSGIDSWFCFAFCLARTLNRTPKTRGNNGLDSCLHCFLLCLLRNQRIKIELCRFAVNLHVTYRKTNRNLLKKSNNRHIWYILTQWNCEIWQYVCVVKTTNSKG